MYPKLPKSTNGKLEILKKRTSSAIKKAPRLKSNSAPQPERLPAFADALYELVEAAGDCDFIDNPKMKAFAAFTRVKVHDDYWYTTRVPEGPRTHLVLSKSEPHLGVDVGHLSSAQQMEHIYQDLHEMSFDGLTSSTIDLDPTLPQGQAVAIADLTTYSIQRDLANRTKEMMMVIDSARLHHQYESKSQEMEQRFLWHGEAAVRTVRTAPDSQRRAQLLASRECRKRTRYGHFAAEHGWMMLSILANSVAFRSACHSFDDILWSALNTSLTENARSLEMFAKVRGLNWRMALTKTPHIGNTLTDADIRSTMDVPIDHPHNFTLTSEGDPQRPRHQGRDQVNIHQNIYNAELLASGTKPSGWPQGWAFPQDPTIRRPIDGPCHICKSPTDCDCRMETATFNPLVEINSYPGRGNGIRALQYIPAGVIIGEYVGELYPWHDNSDPTYCLILSGASGELAQIQCKRYGNWTRYMNHSCNPTAHFCNYTIGDKVRQCIITVRETKIFEEVTVHYGPTYFNEEMPCRCGEPVCEFDTVDKIRAAKIEMLRA